VTRLLLATLFLPAAAVATPLSRAAAQACLEEIGRSTATAASAGPACTTLLAKVRDGADGIAADPDLADALGKTGAEGLRDFAATLPAEAAVPPRRRADPAAVDAVLAALPDPAARPQSLWERLDAWLRRLLSPQDNQSQTPPEWLLRLFRTLPHVPPATLRFTIWLLFAILVGCLVWVVLRELRAAGIVLRRPQRRQPVSRPAEQALPAGVLEALPARERPAAVLRWVIGRLVERGLLPADAALTNRELQALLPPAVSAPFEALAGFAEQAFFGGLSLAPAELDRAVALAQSLTRPEP
jgi:hypothetical protein